MMYLATGQTAVLGSSEQEWEIQPSPTNGNRTSDQNYDIKKLSSGYRIKIWSRKS
jgi:hypothetical protein